MMAISGLFTISLPRNNDDDLVFVVNAEYEFALGPGLGEWVVQGYEVTGVLVGTLEEIDRALRNFANILNIHQQIIDRILDPLQPIPAAGHEPCDLIREA